MWAQYCILSFYSALTPCFAAASHAFVPIELAVEMASFNHCTASTNFDYSKNKQSALLPWRVQGEKAFNYVPSINAQIRVGVFSDGSPEEIGFNLPVDTGSQGLCIGLQYLGSLGQEIWSQVQNGEIQPDGHQYYSSSHILSIGKVIKNFPISLRSSNNAIEGNYDVLASADLLAVYSQIYCPNFNLKRDGYGCKAEDQFLIGEGMNASIIFFGVGFGSLSGQFPPEKNYLINIKEINNTPVGPDYIQGWVISNDGITVGLTHNNTAGFKKIKLVPNPDQQGDWSRYNSTVIVTNPGTGQIPMINNGMKTLIDTGVSNMYLSQPKNFTWIKEKCTYISHTRPLVGEEVTNDIITPGTKVKIIIGCEADPLGEYEFDTITCASSIAQLSKLAPEGALEPYVGRSVNTGRHLLRGYNVMYDSVHGVYGLKKNITFNEFCMHNQNIHVDRSLKQKIG